MDRILPIITDQYYCNSSWFKAMYQSIEKYAVAQKCAVRVISDGLTSEEIDKLPDVVILASGVLSYIKETISVLEAHRKKVILAGLTDSAMDTEHNSVSAATRFEVKNVIDYLYLCNRKKFALVGFREKGMNDAVRYNEIIEYSKSINASFSISNVYFRGNSIEKCIRNFYDDIFLYDAAICPNGAAAIYLINYCKQNQIDIPEDLFVISFSDMHVAHYSNPSLTCVDSDFTMMGKKVVSLWNYMLEHMNEDMVVNWRVKSKLYVRESTACMPFERNDLGKSGNDIPVFYDRFYENRVTNSLFSLEAELQDCDNMDYTIIHMIVRGYSYEQMTEEVFMSISGIRYRVKRLFDKLHVNSRSELVKKIMPLLGEDFYYT